MTKNIYRILGSSSIVSKKMHSDSVETEIIYDNRKPLFSSNDLEQTFKMFDSLVDEDYVENMILIVDFGMLPLGQRIKQALGKYNVGTKWNELVPYVKMVEYHRGVGVENNSPDVSIEMADGNVQRNFHSMEDAMRFFETRLYNPGNMTMKLHDHIADGFSNKKHVKIRTIVNSKEFKCTDTYHPCRKIRVIETRFLSKCVDDDNIISINNVAC